MTEDPRWEPFCLLVKEPTPGQRYQAVRTVATRATDAEDLRELLDMLGLAATDGTDTAIGPREPHARPGPPAELLAELAEFRRYLLHRG
jgi:hypothetical protein